ncbi:MAG: hypothetical protein R2698_08960 [Microthrixaceae bacterium]
MLLYPREHDRRGHHGDRRDDVMGSQHRQHRAGEGDHPAHPW